MTETRPPPTGTTVSETCPAGTELNREEIVGVGLVTLRTNGLALPLAELPHNTKKFPGCGSALTETIVPYGYRPPGGFRATLPGPAAVVLTVVPKTACMRLFLFILTAFV